MMFFCQFLRGREGQGLLFVASIPGIDLARNMLHNESMFLVWECFAKKSDRYAHSLEQGLCKKICRIKKAGWKREGVSQYGQYPSGRWHCASTSRTLLPGPALLPQLPRKDDIWQVSNIWQLNDIWQSIGIWQSTDIWQLNYIWQSTDIRQSTDIWQMIHIWQSADIW